MKTILVPYYGKGAAGTALETAMHLARRFGAYVEGLYVRQLPPIIAGEGITLPGDYMTQLTEEGQELARRSGEEFRAFIEARGVAFGDAAAEPGGVVAGWHEVEGVESQVIGDRGRLFDLIVIGRTDKQAVVDWKASCEAAMFETGRPVLVAGDSEPERVGGRVTIAWNSSTETARTIAMGMQFLREADAVEIVTVEGFTVSGPSGAQLLPHLRRNGVAATERVLEPAGRTPGRTFLEAADEFESDLIVKGAFTHSRLRQMIFGGATSEILSDAKIPVLFAH